MIRDRQNRFFFWEIFSAKIFLYLFIINKRDWPLGEGHRQSQCIVRYIFVLSVLDQHHDSNFLLISQEQKNKLVNERRHYTDSFCVWQHSLLAISSRAFLKKIKVAALILPVCRCVFASVSVMADRSVFAVAAAVLFPDSQLAAKTHSIAGICAKTLAALNNCRRRWNTMSSSSFLLISSFFPRAICISGKEPLASGHFVVFPARFEMMVAFRKLRSVKK